MKINEQARHVPDPALYPELSGDDSDFQLSTIRPEDAGLAMELLIGNYARPMDAVIRELVVNAIDSHREAGQTRPIEITMPSAEHPQLVIRDFGLGLSPTDMVGVYTRPAASTKRGENSSTGGLGIGAKSPFTVADRFVVDGVKDGVRASLVMARIDGQLKHLVRDVQPADTVTSDGVTVTVPTAATDTVIAEWWRALSRVHFWWDRGLVQITNIDESPVPLPDYTERILSRKGLRPSMMTGPTAGVVPLERQATKSTVLMGQIGYDIPDGLVRTSAHVLFRVPVGSLDIAPTRESILDNDRNRAVLEELYHEWREQVIRPYVTILRDRESSIWKICTTIGELRGLGLELHAHGFALREPLVGHDQILQGLRYGHHEPAWPAWQFNARLHGLPSGPAELVMYKEYGSLIAGHAMALAQESADARPMVFADEQALTSSQRSKLSRWAREKRIHVLRIHRARLEGSGWYMRSEYDRTRVFAHDGEIEWIDPGDIRVASAPKKPAAEVTDDTPIQYRVGTVRYGRFAKKPFLSWTDREQSLGELTEWFQGSSKRLAVIDTSANLGRESSPVMEEIIFIASGQRAAKVLQKRIGAQAITVDEFARAREELIVERLTPAQCRHLADFTILDNTRLREYFRTPTGSSWIDDIIDPGAQAVAREIAQIIEKVDRTLERRDKASVNQALAYGPKLRHQRYDSDWVLGNGELGQYARVLLALSASHSGRLYWPTTQTLELITLALSSYASPSAVALDPDVAAAA